MEKYITIPTSDGFEISWVLNWKKKTNKLIIFVHWLTWSMTEAHYYAGKEYFIDKWFEVFRFNLYTDWNNTRKLNNSSVKDHSYDIEKVLDFFTEYKEIYLISHSLGWPSVVWISSIPRNLTKIIFWDPALEMIERSKKCYFDNEKIFTTISWKEIEISKKMYWEFVSDNFLETLEWKKSDFNKMFIIYADNWWHLNHRIDTDTLWIASCVILDSNHGFTQEWKYKELFEKTLEYLEN